MWLINDGPALLTDLYELTMAQVYFRKQMHQRAYFEVFVRHLPRDWGFFVMAGLNELESYLREFRFRAGDIAYLRSTGTFGEDFLEYLSDFRPRVELRALPEGTVFFPREPILEVGGPVIDAQLLESYILNILGFSVIEATLAARTVSAARGVPVVDFGLRRCQGPISSIRAARGAQIGGFKATSNVFAARALNFPPSGTMAHSFVQAHESEEQAFRDFAEIYGPDTILLVDTYDTMQGIKIAARVARDFLSNKGIKIKGIRLDSGDLVELSKFARDYLKREGLAFMNIFVSGDLDEFGIHDLLEAGAEVDGIGLGTRFAVSKYAPAVGIVYKISQYGDDPLHKTSPKKATLPGRKTILRNGRETYEGDTVRPFDADADDLLVTFECTEPIETIQERLQDELDSLPDAVKATRNPQDYPVEFIDFPDT
jgi:nicotinate phosphoribosyltransferase